MANFQICFKPSQAKYIVPLLADIFFNLIKTYIQKSKQIKSQELE